MTSAYMSIKHIEDLRKIRPVISFLIENYEEIFTSDMKPAVQSTIKNKVGNNNNSSSKISETVNESSNNIKGTKKFTPKILVNEEVTVDTALSTPVKNFQSGLSIRTELSLSQSNHSDNIDYNLIEANNNQNGLIHITYNETELKVLHSD